MDRAPGDNDFTFDDRFAKAFAFADSVRDRISFAQNSHKDSCATAASNNNKSFVTTAKNDS
jgi:hypothetical protein